MVRMTSRVPRLVGLIGSLVFSAACGAPDTSSEEATAQENKSLDGDQCPAPHGGLTFQGRRRFVYGFNYPWKDFGADFGGISAWGQKGIAFDAAFHTKKLSQLRAHGTSVVRWWVFPDFRGDGIQFSPDGVPLGLSSGFIRDLDAALRLAEQTDVYLQLCLFSFDGFRPFAPVGNKPGLSGIVRDSAKRRALINRVVRPLARAVAANPNHHRLMSWDLMNEPEWALSGQNPYGDPKYDSMSGLDPVSHQEMETFFRDAISAVRAEGQTLITVGGAAAKWSQAWTRLNLDFHTIHTYDWVNEYYPYDQPPSKWGLSDKPVVIGEYPLDGLTGISPDVLLKTWYENGFAGAISWPFAEPSARQLATMKTFADIHPCETNYSANTAGSRDPSPNDNNATPPPSNNPPAGRDGGACTDDPPDNQYTCAQQVGWGKCNETWMKGKCNKSCKRCGGLSCDDSPPDETFTCAQQVQWNKCAENWMTNRCNRSCGRCGGSA